VTNVFIYLFRYISTDIIIDNLNNIRNKYMSICFMYIYDIFICFSFEQMFSKSINYEQYMFLTIILGDICSLINKILLEAFFV